MGGKCKRGYFSMEDEQPQAEVLLGRCKIFDNKKGFGFVIDVASGNEYFCHRTALNPLSGSENFTPWEHRLHTGEYINFELSENETAVNEDGSFKMKCVNCVGVGNGPLQMEHARIFTMRNYTRLYL